MAVRDPGSMGPDRLGFDSLLHDMFGLNIRGLRTVWDTTFRPSRTFTAARDPDWLHRYTPSIRLVAGLLAVFLLLRFFWEAEDSAVFQGALQAITDQLNLIVAELPEDQRPPPEFMAERALEGTQMLFQNWAIAYPFTFILLHLIIACCLRIWGKGTSTVSRIRLYFLPIATAIALVILFTFGHELYMTPDNLIWLTVINAVITISVYGAIVFFGLKPVHAKPAARVWRGGLYGVLATAGDLGSSLAAFYLGALVPQYWQRFFG